MVERLVRENLERRGKDGGAYVLLGCQKKIPSIGGAGN